MNYGATKFKLIILFLFLIPSVTYTQHLFLEKKEFRGARRYVPDSSDVVTLEIPSGFEVEFDDDIRWVVLQTLPV